MNEVTAKERLLQTYRSMYDKRHFYQYDGLCEFCHDAPPKYVGDELYSYNDAKIHICQQCWDSLPDKIERY